MDSRVRTMSRGYVHVTDVMPARPPQRRRWYAPRGAPGSLSKNWTRSVNCTMSPSSNRIQLPPCSISLFMLPNARISQVMSSDSTTQTERITHPLIHVIRAKLHRRIWHYPYAIRSIPRHKPPPALLSPHLRQRLGHRHLIFISANALYLEQDLQALEG